MKRKIVNTRKENNRENSIINIFNISTIQFSNNSTRENKTMSLKIKGLTATINGEVYDLSNPSQSDAIDFLEYSRCENNCIRLPKKLEDIVARFPNPATFYAAEVLCRRWKKAEVEIIKNLDDIMQYVTFVEAPWKEAEDIIAQDAAASVEYALLIRARFLKGEKAILNSPQHLKEYKEFLTKWIYEQFEADHRI